MKGGRQAVQRRRGRRRFHFTKSGPLREWSHEFPMASAGGSRGPGRHGKTVSLVLLGDGLLVRAIVVLANARR
jgi:hypothetical protein